MASRQILEIRQRGWNGYRALRLACAVLTVLSGAPLHAQLAYSNLHTFNCSTDGCNPWDYGQLTQGPDGYLYGTTLRGSPYNSGTVFKMSTDGSTYSVIVQFDYSYGPNAALTLGSDGYFYGTTPDGGDFNLGTLFRTTTTGGITVLHSFTASDELPVTPPVQGKDGNLYGVTGSGITYRFTLPGGTYTQLPYTAPSQSLSPLFLASDGYLYGTTGLGGTYNLGTVFRMTTPGGAIKIMHNFSGADGAVPYGSLTQAPDGNLYGTTSDDGGSGAATVFRMTLSGKLTVLHSFASDLGPWAGLLAASDGNLYGSTYELGSMGLGSLFKISTSGVFTNLYDFTGGTGAILGEFPKTALMEDTDGCFFGLTGGDFVEFFGNAYSLCPSITRRIPIVKIAGPIFIRPGVPVEILGDNLIEAVAVGFGGVPAQFRAGSETYLIANVPWAAVDGPITVTLTNPAGGEEQVQSLQAMHILPRITNLDPTSGTVGSQVGIVGGGFLKAKKVTFGGVAATSFTVATPTLIQAIVPTGALTGKVRVTTPNGTAASTQTFTVN